MAGSLVRREKKTPKARNSPTVADSALSDANDEAVLFLKDVAMEVPYAPFAKAGMTFQNFARTRRIAFQDEFEDISEEDKIAGLDDQVDIQEIRQQHEYMQIRSMFREALSKITQPQDSKQFIERIGKHAWAKIARSFRDRNPEMSRESIRAAQTILEIEQPKASRQLPPVNVIQMPEELILSITKALREEKVVVPEPPRRIKDESG